MNSKSTNTKELLISKLYHLMKKNRSSKVKKVAVIVLIALILWILWQFYEFTMLVFSRQNRTYLLRTLLQSAEGVWGFYLFVQLFSQPKKTFEKNMLLSLWLLFGLWYCVQLPLGFASRDPLIFSSPNLLFFQKTLPFLSSFTQYMLLLWGLLGLITLGFYRAKKRWADVDEVFLPALFFLIYQGVYFLARLGPDRLQAQKSSFNQVVYLLLGVLAGTLLFHPKIRKRAIQILDYPYLCLIASVLLLAGTFFFGTAVSGGRKLWYKLGPLTVQPIEGAKILFIFVLAVFLQKHVLTLQKRDLKANLLTLCIICSLLFSVLMLQRDLGPLLVLLAVTLIMFLTVSGRWALFSGAVAMTALGVLISFFTRFPSMVYHRIMDFWDPLHYSGQLTKGLWAQASGGLWGTTPGMSQAYKIPVIESDYLFSLIVAEKGLLGTALFLVVFFVFCFRGFQTSRFLMPASRRDATVILGIFLLFVVQGALIMGGNMAFLPLSGLTLPFVSAGGSSLVINLLAFCFTLALVASRVRKVTPTGDQP
ncbi:MAG: hypothetical protein CR997_02960 [Acidobacteria bacterium]|nr:MAG: hypothetical protein CR997_02960 [Acidobacteriota bacterium]